MKISADSLVAQVCGSLVLYPAIGWWSPAILAVGLFLQFRRRQMFAQIQIDLSNLPKKIRVHLGAVEQVICRKHFELRFKNSNGVYAWGSTIVTLVEPAEDNEACLDCLPHLKCGQG